jgi:hypothetical protein
MVVTPRLRPVTTPVMLSTEAIVGCRLVHRTIRFASGVAPALVEALRVNRPPTRRAPEGGLTETAVTVAAEIVIAAAPTRVGLVLVVARIVTGPPALIPVTSPDAVTVAIAVLLELHLT